MAKNKNTSKCDYCGMKLPKGVHICSECCKKRGLIRFMQQMVRDTFERVKKDEQSK